MRRFVRPRTARLRSNPRPFDRTRGFASRVAGTRGKSVRNATAGRARLVRATFDSFETTPRRGTREAYHHVATSVQQFRSYAAPGLGPAA